MTATALLLAAETTFAVSGHVATRLLFAALLGALIGTEREANDQPAGVRTHIAVAIGACLFGLVSTVGLEEYGSFGGSNLRVDVGRVASNVVVGIGFLGAGVIFRQGNAIRNLTTAASLWVVAAIGLSCGVGDLGAAMVTTALMLGILVLLRPYRTLVQVRLARTAVAVRATLSQGVEPPAVLAAMQQVDGAVLVDSALHKDEGRYVVVGVVEGHPDRVRSWLTTMSLRPDVDVLTDV